MRKRYIVALIFILIATIGIGALLIYSINNSFHESYYVITDLVRTETMYIVLVLVVLLFVGMLTVFKSLNKKRRFIKKQKRKLMLATSSSEIFLNTEIVEEPLEEEFDENRFFMLSELDNMKTDLQNISYNENITLEELCHDFRLYSAHKLGLYYDIEDIRRFIGSLAVTDIIILQGMSGTGKTSLAYAFGEFVENPSVIVPVQPMWKERTDLIGYYNEFTRKFNETTLLQKLYEANYSEGMYITVLDEINIARIEYYFAEFLSLLEIPDYNKRNLDVVSNKWDNDPKLLNKGQISLPFNMWFVGTANNDDSTFAISDKVYDRAMVINLDKRARPFIVNNSQIQRVKAKTFYNLVRKAQKQYSMTDRNLRRIRQLDKYLIENFQITFGNRIMQQIRNYVPVMIASGGSELSAIDDILSKKVLRKLEAKNLAYVKSAAPGLISFIDELFGEDELIQCKEYILHFEMNI